MMGITLQTCRQFVLPRQRQNDFYPSMSRIGLVGHFQQACSSQQIQIAIDSATVALEQRHQVADRDSVSILYFAQEPHTLRRQELSHVFGSRLAANLRPVEASSDSKRLGLGGAAPDTEGKFRFATISPRRLLYDAFVAAFGCDSY
jgi:hypothetical protein